MDDSAIICDEVVDADEEEDAKAKSKSKLFVFNVIR